MFVAACSGVILEHIWATHLIKCIIEHMTHQCELTAFAPFFSAHAARGRTRNRSRGVREYAGDQTAGPGRR